MSQMPMLELFKARARAKNWKAAFDDCNGLSMYDMLRGLDSLDVALLRDMRAQIPVFSVWGGPYMPRIQYAMDVVELRKLPTVVPGDLKETGQVLEAVNFLATRAPVAASKKIKLKLVMFWTKATLGEVLSTRLIQKAQDFLHNNGDRFTLDVMPQRSVLPFAGELMDSPELDQVRDLADRAIAFGPDRLPVIFYKRTPDACSLGSICGSVPNGFTPVDKHGRAFVMLNAAVPAKDDVTLMHEIGHAAKILPADDKESDINNFMSWGSNRSTIRDAQLKKLEKAYFASK